MIIFGTTTLNSTVDSGTFTCPRCQSQQPHRVVGANRWFTLFFVPVIPLGRKGVFVECRSCAGTFSTDVLEAAVEAVVVSGSEMPATAESSVVQDVQVAEKIYATTSGMAVASLIASLVSPLLCFLGVIPAAVGVVLGFLSLRRINASAGRLRGRVFAYAGMILGGCCFVLSGAMFVSLLMDFSETRSGDGASAQRDTAADVLLDAESRIRTNGDSGAHGNTEHARDLAAQFANDMGVLRNELFTEGSDGISLSGGNFITYCHVSPNRCAFLVHVPQYRKFTGDAKESLEMLAWTVARNTVQPELGDSTELAVGLKGVILYGSVMVGDAMSEKPSYKGKDSKRLHSFFRPVGRAPDAESTTPAEPTVDEPPMDIPREPSTGEPVAP